MKTNGAPKKLYLLSNGLISYCRNTDEDVEYIRTDAFIEKTCEWLSDNLQTIRDEKSPSKHHVGTIPVFGSITQTEFLEKFKREIIL